MKLSEQQKQTIRDMYPTHTNAEIGQVVGVPKHVVKQQGKQLGLRKPTAFLSDFQKRNTGGMATRLTGGIVRQPPGTVAWLLAGGGSAEYEWHIYRGQGHPVALKRHLWEQHLGIIPPGYIVRYIDGNPRRCVLSNLECISRAENAQRNRNDQKRTETYRRGGFADSYFASRLFYARPALAGWALTNAPALVNAHKQQLLLSYQLNNPQINEQSTTGQIK